MVQYHFMTTWRIPAPPDAVWGVLQAASEYSSWWKNMLTFRDLTPGVTGPGSRTERTVRGALPYTLRYDTIVTSIDPPREMSYNAEGDLNGSGRLVVRIAPEGAGTEVVWYWDVGTKGFLMNLFAPLLKGLFAWNHNAVMREGELGLIRRFTSDA